jgi:molybdopterin synthase sulfur carrier subunit
MEQMRALFIPLTLIRIYYLWQDVEGSAPISTILDALEDQHPVLQGTIRNQASKQRWPFIRFYACGEDLSQDPPTNQLPEKVITGEEPFRVVGAMAGG